MEEMDWQISRHELKDRGQYLLETGKWADCHFLLGSEPNQQMLAGHKLILAMASPVFEAMFYGGLAEKNDPIPILDVQPEAFKALLEYIYTDKININSVDKACELCYGAKKYMLPHVVEQCTKFLWSDLQPKNACRAYEFAKLFEEPRLMERCLQIICTKTLEVLQDPSFEDIELNTMMKILDQDFLNIDSELNLFYAISRYAEKHNIVIGNINQAPNHLEQDNQEIRPPSVNQEIRSPSVNQDDQQEQQELQAAEEQQNQQRLNICDAIKKIRFLTLTPQQFAEGPGRSNLLTQSEAFAILMNISSPNSVYPMPEGYTKNTNSRVAVLSDSESPSPVIVPVEPMRLDRPPQHESPSNIAGPSHNHNHNQPFIDEMLDARHFLETRRYYCVRAIRQQTDCLNTSVLDCSVTFTVDRSICITGVQVPTQVLGESNMSRYTDGNLQERYSELLYAHLLDSLGSRLTYTHCTSRVRFDSMLEISFDRPVYIQRNKSYKIGVVFNKVGWYPMCICLPTMPCSNVLFNFGVGPSNESIRDGLIRAIVFTLPRESL